MSKPIPTGRWYTKEHEWAMRAEKDVVIGITDHAQAQLGDVVYLELPEIGTTLKREQPFGVVESVKAVSDLYAPIDGTVVDVNSALVEKPETVNTSPYDDAWMVRIAPSSASQLDQLMNADTYARFLQDEAKSSDH